MEQPVISALAMNKVKGNIKVNVINAPTYGITKKEMLTDLSMLTGATVINEDLGDDLDLIKPEFLGTCLKSITTDEETILQIEQPSEEIKKTIKKIKKDLSKNKPPAEIIRLEKRLARLSAKVSIVKVGANSEIELKEKSDRVEDAICATKAAIKEGIVPGAGIALHNAADSIKDPSNTESILLDAIKYPYKTILNNAGIKYGPFLDTGWGINVITGEGCNLIKSGIIDPLLVTKSALSNAVSVATTILSTDCVINNLRVNESNR